MDPLVDIDPIDPTVSPGGQTTVSVGIRNPGSVQTEYEVTVVGPAAAYATVNPQRVTVNVRGAESTQVTFLPRRDPSTTTGRIPFGVKVGSLEGDGSTVAEGDLTVGDFTELAVRLVPTNSRGRWKGRHKLVIDNGGTARQSLQVRPDEDSEIDLSFAFTPDASSVVVGAGQKAELFVVVRAKHPALFGKREPLPFTLMVEEPSRRVQRESVGKSVKGTFLRRQILSKGLLVVAAIAAALVAVGIANVKENETFSEAESVTLDTPPPVVVEEAGAGGLRVTWSTVQGATGYQVDAADLPPNTVAAEELSVILGASEGLEVGTEYCFRVKALGDDAGLRESASSEDGPASCGTPREQTIDPPNFLDAQWVGEVLDITWDPIPDDGSAVMVEIGGEALGPFAVDSGVAHIPIGEIADPTRVSTLKIYRQSADGQSNKVPEEGFPLEAAPIPESSVPEATSPVTTETATTTTVAGVTVLLGLPQDLTAEQQVLFAKLKEDVIQPHVDQLLVDLGIGAQQVRFAFEGRESSLKMSGLSADEAARFCDGYNSAPPTTTTPSTVAATTLPGTTVATTPEFQFPRNCQVLP